jgi:hypothetical protein
MSGISIPRARGPMIKDAPDHHDADLVLRLYDLRRESKMREARAFMAGEFWPAGAEEAVALAKHDHPKNALYRQFFGYWEMAYGMARHGIVNPDYLVEFASEGLFVFAKVHAWVEQIRAVGGPRTFRNTEWIATECEMGRVMMTELRPRIEQIRAARRGA